MKVRITEGFTGYPDDTDKSRTEYRVGQTLDLDETFARLIIGKGHAEEHNAKPAQAGSRSSDAATQLGN